MSLPATSDKVAAPGSLMRRLRLLVTQNLATNSGTGNKPADYPEHRLCRLVPNRPSLLSNPWRFTLWEAAGLLRMPHI